MTRTRRNDLFAIAILTLLTTLLFADVIAGRATFHIRDLSRFYYPTKQVLREIVQNGEFPYWSRHAAAGQPVAANPEHEVFYPPTWLILLPGYDLGFRLLILIHIYLGLVGMYALLRSMELRPPAAMLGAISFGLGGLQLTYVSLLPILFAAAWLPLIALFFRRYLLARNPRDFAIAALLFTLQLLVGEPTTILQTGFLLGMYALYRGWYAARDIDRPHGNVIREMLTRVASVALLSACSLGLAAVQILPAVDLVRETARARGFDFETVSAWSLPPGRLAELIFPNILGYNAIDGVAWQWQSRLYPEAGGPYLFSIYPGIFATILLLAGARKGTRGGRLVLVICLLALLAALGRHTPLLRVLFDAGVATSIRYPEKFVFTALFALVIFAAQVFQRMLDGDETIRRRAMTLALVSALFAAVLSGLAAGSETYAEAFRTFGRLEPGAVAARMLELSRNGWCVATLRGLLLFVLLASLRRFAFRPWFAIAILLIVADLAIVGRQVSPRMPSEFLRGVPPAAEQFPRDRNAFRIFHEADWDEGAEAARYRRTGPAYHWIVRNGLFPMMPAAHALQTVMERDYDKTALLPTVEFLDAMRALHASGRPDWQRPLMAMSNVWFHGVYRPFAEESARVGGKMESAQPVRFEEIAHHPRYYFAEQLGSIDGAPAFVHLLSRPGLSDRVALVTGPAFRPSPGSVRSVFETANSAVIDVEAKGRAFLVMSVTPHKYWRIRLDGHHVRPLVANLGFQGIEVPAGRHRVEMRYRNPLIAVGAGVSLVTLLLLSGATIVLARRR